MQDFIVGIFDDYGLLVPYSIIIAFIGLSASSISQLIASLAIICGLYVLIFKMFAMTLEFGLLDLTDFFGLPAEQGNLLMMGLFVYSVGIGTYLIKGVVLDKNM
ncbi:MAG: hypothetical protein ACRBBN_09340 [Methyloligellaceae bacterium]